jgi:hypothetical protein
VLTLLLVMFMTSEIWRYVGTLASPRLLILIGGPVLTAFALIGVGLDANYDRDKRWVRRSARSGSWPLAVKARLSGIGAATAAAPRRDPPCVCPRHRARNQRGTQPVASKGSATVIAWAARLRPCLHADQQPHLAVDAMDHAGCDRVLTELPATQRLPHLRGRWQCWRSAARSSDRVPGWRRDSGRPAELAGSG